MAIVKHWLAQAEWPSSDSLRHYFLNVQFTNVGVITVISNLSVFLFEGFQIFNSHRKQMLHKYTEIRDSLDSKPLFVYRMMMTALEYTNLFLICFDVLQSAQRKSSLLIDAIK